MKSPRVSGNWPFAPVFRLAGYGLVLLAGFALLLVACEPDRPEDALPPASPEASPPVSQDTPLPSPSPTISPRPEETLVPTEPAPFEPEVGLVLVAEGLVAPVSLAALNDESGRLFIADQSGVIHIITPGQGLLDEPLLDLRERMVRLNSGYDERGLLGLALHPGFAENGRIFVYYSAPLRSDGPGGWDHTSHVSEFHVPPGGDRVELASERIILEIDQPQANHNGGDILFGPDGYLYIALGDGGGSADTGRGHPPLGNAQDISTLLGSIVRIDVDGGEPYSIPEDNPLVGTDGRDEIYAYGFRNPYRLSFDAGGQFGLIAADVGQDLWEEASLVTAGGNYGWNIKEGTHCFDPANPRQPPEDCPQTGPRGEALIDPAIEYPQMNLPDGLGLAIIGGYLYRGSALPNFQGRYLFGDWSRSFVGPDGTLFVATPPEEEGQMWPFEVVRISTNASERMEAFLLGFGQDTSGEIYLLTSQSSGPSGQTGRVYRLVPAGGS